MASNIIFDFKGESMKLHICFPTAFEVKITPPPEGSGLPPIPTIAFTDWYSYDVSINLLLSKIKKPVKKMIGKMARQVAIEIVSILVTTGKRCNQLLSPKIELLHAAIKAYIARLDLPSIYRELLDGHAIHKHSTSQLTGDHHCD